MTDQPTRRRWFSLNVTFPALITGIVLLTSLVLLWSARRAFSRVLFDASGARLASSARLVAGLIEDGVPASRQQLARLAELPEIRHLLGEGEDTAFVTAAVRGALPRPLDSARVQIRLLDRTGRVRHTVALQPSAATASWADSAIRGGTLSTSSLTYSPLLADGAGARFELVLPVHARGDGESLVGYVVESRAVRGRGVAAVRQLIGTSTMLFGQPDAGVWSDLERRVPGPPPIAALDSTLVFDASPRGPGVGVAHQIRGTPWIIWLQISREQALAPLTSFLRRMAPVVIGVALLGAWLAWWFSRRITTRIVRLTAAVDQVAPAPRDARDSSRTGVDEIDRLERSFQLMSARAKVQQQLESQLQQSQKLEAVGRLAGGIAHDFNNVLTVVTNFGEIIRSDLEPNSPTARDLEQILHAATRASGLTRQLLAFSRRQLLQPVHLDINEVMRNAHRMLERLIPSRVTLVLDLAPDLGTVLADPVQIEQVLLNLAANASDAMPDGGTLTFRTVMTELDEGASTTDGPARTHVCLIVKDTGVGMDRETQQRIFEPFFTTKAIGKGTGLGLATVHGIITQLGGRIWLYSEPLKGTTFKIFLPAVQGTADTPTARRELRQLPRASATVLLVEDDAGTRAVTKRLLSRQGYRVVEMVTADEAMRHLERDAATIDLILSDVMMPGMNGVEFARRVGTQWPTLPLLLMSGYSDAEVIDSGDLTRWTFVEKPFSATSLLGAVSDALEHAERRH